MLPGENRLIATALSLPDDAAEGEASAEVSLVSGGLDSEKGPTDILAQTEVSPEITKLTPGAPTVVLAHAFHLAVDAVPWTFIGAEALELPGRSGRVDTGHENDSLVLVRSVRDAIASRNVKQLVSMFATVISETASATETARMEVENAFVAEWTDIVTEDDVRLREATLTLEAGDHGRVLHARGPLGSFPIVVETRAATHALGLAFARIDGVTRIVR